MDRRQFVLGITSIAAGLSTISLAVSKPAVKKPEFLAELWSEEIKLAYKQEIELAAKLVN